MKTRTDYLEEIKDNLLDKYNYWLERITDEDVSDLSYNINEAIENLETFPLYHYAPTNFLNIYNIEKGQVHLSPNGSLNDIYEGIPVGEYSKSDIIKLYDATYMHCFSESYENMLMWSHYADSNKGICIEYDLKLLQETNPKLLEHIFPVLYTEKRLNIIYIHKWIDNLTELQQCIDSDKPYENKNILNNIIPIFLIKGENWVYEQEWRLIFSKKQLYNNYKELLNTQLINFNCITAIYLGYHINPIYKEYICEMSQRLNNRIHIYQAKLSKNKYQIEFDTIVN